MAGTGLIEAYLDQLRTQLARTPDTDDVIAEVEDHLHTIVEAHLSLGLTEEAATRHALGAFGSADLVARAFAQQRGDHTAMPTTFTTTAGAAAIVGGIVLGISLALASVTTLDVGSTTSWFAPTAVTGGLLTIIGLIGLDARHRAMYGSVGRVARALVPVGLFVVLVSLATWFAPGFFVDMAATVLGLVGLGVEAWRGGVIHRAAVAFIALGLLGLPLVSLITWDPAGTSTLGSLVGITAFGLIGAGLVWLGYGLWRERADLDLGGTSRPTPA